MWEMDRTMAKCPVNLCRISVTDLENHQSHKTYILACNLIKTLTAKFGALSWTINCFVLVSCVHCTFNPSADISARPSLWGLHIELEGFVMKMKIHLYTNDDFFGSTHKPKLPVFLKCSTLSELPVFTSVSSGSGTFLSMHWIYRKYV